MLDVEDRVQRQQARALDPIEAGPQRLPIPQHFLDRRPGRLGRLFLPIQIVLGRDDVLDGRTVARFLQGQRVDQDPLVRDARGDALQLGQVAAGLIQRLEDRGGFEAFGIEFMQRPHRHSKKYV